MSDRYNELRNSEFLPINEKVSDDEIVQQKIYHSSKKDYERIVFKDKVKKVFKTTFFAVVLTISITITAVILFLYYSNKSKEKFIAQQNYHISNLKRKLSQINQEEEEQLRRINKYQNIIGMRLPNIREKILTKEVKQNIVFLKNKYINSKGYNITRGNVKFKEIALTFDLASGADCGYLYKLVKKTGVKVTIFISNEQEGYGYGSLIRRRNIYWLKKFAKLGDQVEFGNHTWSHYNMVKSLNEKSFKKRYLRMNITREPINAGVIHRELTQVEDRFYNLTRRRLSKIWRTPYGAYNSLILKIAGKFGYKKHIFWTNGGNGHSLDIPDYISKRMIVVGGRLVKNPLYMTREQVLKMLVDWEIKDKHGMNGAIILMHLGTNRKVDKLINVLPEFIKKMKDKGYRFVTTSEVLNNRLD